MQSDKTFSTRSNAKRNAIKAGVPEDQIEIVPHGKGDDVRFGWCKQGTKPKTTVQRKATRTEPAIPEVRNGVKRPREGTICRAVWDWLDKNPGISVRDAKEAAPTLGFNVNNVACEYYAHRKWVAAS